MIISKNINRYFSGKLLILVSATLYCLNLDAFGLANAQQPVNSTVTQSTSPQPTDRNAPRRPNPGFFEEERRQQFGFGKFLDSALDGADNYFASDSVSELSNASLNPLSAPVISPINGTLTVLSRNENSPNFLKTTFAVTPDAPIVTLSSPQYGTDPRIGTLTVNGAVQANGKTINFSGRRNYSGSFAIKDNNVSGAVQVVDPNDPSTTIFIQLPQTQIPNVDDDNQPLSAPAQLSIGLPSDR